MWMQERGFDIGKRFTGEVTMAGKDNGKDCSVGTQDLTGKVGHRPCQLFLNASFPVGVLG